MTTPVRWGLLATGGISALFARDLGLLPDAEVLAVGSRSQASADRFGAEFDIPRRYGSYADLVADPDVDAIYVATPHPGHHAATLLALDEGKAVLVEKPFAMNGAEAREMVAAARAASSFLMEAMWTRFLPHMVRVRDALAAGVLGDIVYLTAEHGQWFPLDRTHRVFAPELGGGALLDLGIYPVSFAHMVLGTPSAVTAVSTPAFTGVDATTSITLRYPGGQHAVLTTSLSAASDNPAAIYGTEARLEIEGWFYTPSGFTITSRDGKVIERYETPRVGRGMQYQAEEVMRCLRSGRLESDVLPLAETVATMDTLDEVRRQIGLVYPGE
jgi:predicted dehydrogenase